MLVGVALLPDLAGGCAGGTDGAGAGPEQMVCHRLTPTRPHWQAVQGEVSGCASRAAMSPGCAVLSAQVQALLLRSFSHV